jgi:serine/threonine-protein kinase
VWTFARDRYGRLREDRGERWDAAELAVIRGLQEHGFRDAFRALHGPERREPTWEWPRWGGGYRLDHLVGEGATGAVYLGTGAGNGARAAVRLVAPALARDAAFRERFVREARATRALRHPNVVPVYDAGEHDDVLYVVTEFIEGTDLKSMLARDGPLDAGRTTRLLAQVAGALDAAHEAGLLHRDVKPGNVLIASGAAPDGTERAYLSDFGLAMSPSPESVARAAQGEFAGTIDYAAPELVVGQDFDSRLDVYSLGCVFYECLAGRPPFERDGGVAVLYAHMQDPPPKITDARPDVPPALDEVLAKAMAKKPDDRFASATEFVDAARAVVGEPPPPPPLAPSTLAMRVTGGNAAGTVISVDDELVIGRQAPGQGRLAGDIEISRRHARITREPDGGFVIEDLGSTNGTFVNGDEVSSRPLQPHDVIELGDTRLLVLDPAEAADAPDDEPVPAGPAGRLAVTVEVERDSGEVAVVVDDPEGQVRFVKREGRWAVEP